MSQIETKRPEPEEEVYPGLSRGPGHGHPKPWRAALLGLVAPGLGHVYARAPWRGLGVVALVVLVVGPAGRTLTGFLAVSRTGLLVAVGLVVAVLLIVNPIDAWRTARRGRPRTAWNRWWVYALYLVVYVVVVPPAHRLLAEHARFRQFVIPSSSMSETLLAGDYVVADMQAIDPETLRRGEILVYRRTAGPDGWITELAKGPDASRPEEILVGSRLVGMPGETIALRDAVLHVDGVPIEEPYLAERARDASIVPDFGPVRVPTGEYFFLGDNRDRSQDSRYVGTVPADALEGRVRIVYVSIDRPLPGSGGSTRIRWHRIGLLPGGER